MRTGTLIVVAAMATMSSLGLLAMPTQAAAKNDKIKDKEQVVPELDASGAFAAFALVGAAGLVVAERRRRHAKS
jgi:hypothetical protein